MPKLPDKLAPLNGPRPKIIKASPPSLAEVAGSVRVLAETVKKLVGRLDDLEWRFKLWTDEQTKDNDDIPF